MMLADGYSACQTIAQILKINCNVAMRHIQFEQMLERLLQFQRNTVEKKQSIFSMKLALFSWMKMPS
jgi:hypothetical protein